MDRLEAGRHQGDHQHQPAQGERRLVVAPRRLVGLREHDEVGLRGQPADLLAWARAAAARRRSAAPPSARSVCIASSAAPEGQRQQTVAVAELELAAGSGPSASERGAIATSTMPSSPVSSAAFGRGRVELDLAQLGQGLELLGLGGQQQAVAGLDDLVRRDRQPRLSSRMMPATVRPASSPRRLRPRVEPARSESSETVMHAKLVLRARRAARARCRRP